MKSPRFSLTQSVFLLISSLGSLIGIYFFMASQVDMTDDFAIGAYLFICLIIISLLIKYVRDNIKQK